MYTVELLPRARADMRRLDATTQGRVGTALHRLCETCDERPHHALKGIHRGKFRLKVAKVYRIVYTFNKRARKVTVHQIGHRNSVY